MFRFKYTYAFLFLVTFGMLIRDSIFIVWEGEQALVTQFGEILRDPITEAGIHFKIPFIQLVEIHDRRYLSWEGTSEQVPTGDQRYISVKTIAQWKITDLSAFIQSVQTVPLARARLDSIISGTVRDVVSAYDMVESVRMDNSMLEHESITNDVARDEKTRDLMSDDSELYTVLQKVQAGRAILEQSALAKANQEANKLGITIGALNFKDLQYQESVEHTVYARMISERRRVAEKIRAVGRSEEARIRGRMTQEYQAIAAPAQRDAEILKGTADAEAVKIYAQAVGQEPDFFRFLRTMDAYKRGITKDNGSLIMSSKSSFFKAMKEELGG